jgi:hypothetical protein
VIRPGGSASRPMSMKTNDDPQIAATEMNNAQSCGVNWPSFEAVAAVNNFLEAVGALLTEAR